MSLALSVRRTERVNLRETFEEKLTSTTRFERVNQLAEEMESNLTITSLPFFDREKFLEKLYALYYQLIEKRNKLLNSLFFSLRPAQKKNLKIIDQQLDSLEQDIVKFRQELSQKEIKEIENFIEENERYIERFPSKECP